MGDEDGRRRASGGYVKLQKVTGESDDDMHIELEKVGFVSEADMATFLEVMQKHLAENMEGSGDLGSTGARRSSTSAPPTAKRHIKEDEEFDGLSCGVLT